MPISLKAITPRRLYRFEPNLTRKQARRAMEKYLEKVKYELQSGYRNVPGSPKYQRTYNLFDSFEITVNQSGTKGELINTQPYAVYVIGPRSGGRGIGSRQARHMRQRGWQSVSDVARKLAPEYRTVMNRSIQPRFVTTADFL